MPLTINLANGDVVQTTIVCRFDEQSSENVLHWRVTRVPPNVYTLAQALLGISNLIEAQVKQLVTSNTRFEGIIGRIAYPPLNTSPSIADTSNAGVGTIVGFVMPRQVACIITKLGNLPGPKGRGRMYSPFPPQTAMNADTTVTAAYMVKLDNLAQLLFTPQVLTTGGNTITLTPIIFRGGVAPVLQDIQTYVVRDRFATMRKRGSYGRANRPL